MKYKGSGKYLYRTRDAKPPPPPIKKGERRLKSLPYKVELFDDFYRKVEQVEKSLKRAKLKLLANPPNDFEGFLFLSLSFGKDYDVYYDIEKEVYGKVSNYFRRVKRKMPSVITRHFYVYEFQNSNHRLHVHAIIYYDDRLANFEDIKEILMKEWPEPGHRAVNCKIGDKDTWENIVNYVTPTIMKSGAKNYVREDFTDFPKGKRMVHFSHGFPNKFEEVSIDEIDLNDYVEFDRAPQNWYVDNKTGEVKSMVNFSILKRDRPS